MKRLYWFFLQSCVYLFFDSEVLAEQKTKNLLDLETIFSKNYSYSLPMPILENFILEKTFDNINEYSVAGKIKLDQDIEFNWEKKFNKIFYHIDFDAV